MAIPTVLLTGELDKPTRLRLALTGGSALDKEARLVTIEDIKSRWTQLGDTGYFPRDILKLANWEEQEISDKAFTTIMKALNSYL
mgnify:CR=1 FL=1